MFFTFLYRSSIYKAFTYDFDSTLATNETIEY